MWLFYSSVMELIAFFSPLNTFPARVHKNLKFAFVNQSRKRVQTNFQRSQVSSETR